MRSKMKNEWRQKLWYEKILYVIGILCAVSVIVLAFAQLLDIWETAIYVYMPLTAVLMLIQAWENWKRSRAGALVCLCAAGFIVLVSLLVFFAL